MSCWIERPSLDEAIQVARSSVEAEGWIVGEPEMAHPIHEGDYMPNDNSLKYLEQARIDKEVFLFHCFPEADGRME